MLLNFCIKETPTRKLDMHTLSIPRWRCVFDCCGLVLKVHPLELPWRVSRTIQLQRWQGLGAFSSTGQWHWFVGDSPAWTVYMCWVGHGECNLLWLVYIGYSFLQFLFGLSFLSVFLCVCVYYIILDLTNVITRVGFLHGFSERGILYCVPQIQVGFRERNQPQLLWA